MLNGKDNYVKISYSSEVENENCLNSEYFSIIGKFRIHFSWYLLLNCIHCLLILWRKVRTLTLASKRAWIWLKFPFACDVIMNRKNGCAALASTFWLVSLKSWKCHCVNLFHCQIGIPKKIHARRWIVSVNLARNLDSSNFFLIRSTGQAM